MNEKPINHGADHRPGGTDPIPGVRPFAYYSLTIGAGTLANGATGYTDVSSGFPWVENQYADVFDVGSRSVGGGSHTGPVIKQNGIYLWKVGLIPGGLVAIDGPCDVQFATTDYAEMEAPWIRNWEQLGQQMEKSGLSFETLLATDGAPVLPTIFKVINNTGSNFTALSLSVSIEQKSVFVPGGGYPVAF